MSRTRSGSRPAVGRRVVAGALAGALGTAAMDATRYVRAQRSREASERESFADWELSRSTRSFEDAGAPAQIGRLLASSVGVQLPPEAARTTNNAVHWLTGVQWGALYGLVASGSRRRDARLGSVLGAASFAVGYVVLPLLHIYKPIWQYDRKSLADDLSAHMLFGSVTAAAFRVLA